MSTHVVPAKVYAGIFGILIVLALLTTGVAYINLGPFSIVVALTIAIVKMVLVILYFMHVRWSSRLTWVFVGAGFAWLLILMGLSLTDYASRYWMPAPAKAPGMTNQPL
ncbi:MAG TPA: cytochrome C oxidase subunit IV family protein [Bryobacteraceae bacterium]|nr:cytochrome C oxidase subunit IV family protein [Bryobacteraceae bacterium]